MEGIIAWAHHDALAMWERRRPVLWAEGDRRAFLGVALYSVAARLRSPG
jgi:hypothetical protein